jgi:hypothetical protein
MANFEDLTAKRIGRLTVIARAKSKVEPSGRKRTQWLCECDCGNKVIVSACSLHAQTTKSCGCLKSERNKRYFTKHGCAGDRLYSLWTDIKKRCSNPNYKQYKDYGGRGITVCNEWENDFAAFRDWAISNGYDYNAKFGECTIDRIDVNGNYEPLNCRFISIKEQAKNKRGARK